MAASHRLFLQRSFGALFMLFCLLCGNGSAQSVSAPVLAGTPFNLTVEGLVEAPQADSYINLFSPTGKLVFNATVSQPTEKVLTVPALAAGSYQLEIYNQYSDRSPEFFWYSLFVFPADAGSPSSLQGQYTFQLSGHAANIASGPSAVSAIGSLTADGNGNLTAGTVDINTPAGLFTVIPLTGTYSINAFGNGVVRLVTFQGNFQFDLLGKPLVTSNLPIIANGLPYPLNPAPAFPVLTGASITSNAAGLISGAGSIVQQTTTSAPAYLSGQFHSGFTGEQSQTVTPFGGAGFFQLNADGTATLNATLGIQGTSFDLNGLAGSYTPFDPTTGRSTLTLHNPNQPDAPDQIYALYQTGGGAGFLFEAIAPRAQQNFITGGADLY